jgi:DNA replication protein DnaC
MKPIGKIIKPLESDISRGRSPTTSSTDDGHGPPRDEGGSGGEGQCPRCGGLGWLRRDVPLDHPDFGRAFPCDCIADELAERRLASVQRVSHMAALDRMTFETFEVEAPGNSPDGVRSLRRACEAARRFAEQPEGWLVLRGGYGCGKTHLAAAIVHERLRQGGSALFVVVPDLLDHLRAAFSPGSGADYDERFEAVRGAPLLVLDDLGTQAPTAWAAEKLFQLLNHRYNAQLPTVVTTNVDLGELDERLRSRLGDFDVVRVFEINALDYRGGVLPDGDLSSLNLYASTTFQTWDHRVGELEPEDAANLRHAFDSARAFAAQPDGWLVLMGDHGCGKTHLAAAVANQRATDGGAVLFVVVPDLLDHLRATFSPTSRVSYDKRFDEIRAAPLLVLDDLGTESATPWAQEKLFQILNHRYAARLPTVITMSTPLEDAHPRLASRMLDSTRCRIVAILAPSFRGTVGRGSRGAGRGRRGGRRR